MRMPVVRTIAAAAMLLILPASPASADQDRLQLSHDRSQWRSDLAEPLFRAGAMVPTEVRTSRFFVRNTSPDAARLVVAVVDRSPAGSELSRHLSVTVNTHKVRRTPDCDVVLRGPLVSPGAVRRVDVRLAFDDVTGEAAQDSSARFNLVVALTESTREVGDLCGEHPPPSEGDPRSRPGVPVAVVAGLGGLDAGEDTPRTAAVLPDTGAEANLGWLLGSGLGCLLLGLLLAARRRRKEAA